MSGNSVFCVIRVFRSSFRAPRLDRVRLRFSTAESVAESRISKTATDTRRERQRRAAFGLRPLRRRPVEAIEFSKSSLPAVGGPASTRLPLQRPRCMSRPPVRVEVSSAAKRVPVAANYSIIYRNYP
jgi:hypothetical protein